jgi:hypothetical protein
LVCILFVISTQTGNGLGWFEFDEHCEAKHDAFVTGILAARFDTSVQVRSARLELFWAFADNYLCEMAPPIMAGEKKSMVADGRALSAQNTRGHH